MHPNPTPAIRLSAGLHTAAFVLAVVMPAWWLLALAIVLVNQAVLAFCCFQTRSTLLGDNLSRLPDASAARGEIALTFDDGPDPDITPRILAILERYGARASFFVVGERVFAHPEWVRETIARGHSVENHSHRHSMHFGFSAAGLLRREIVAAQAAILAAGGQPARFFRPPFGIRATLLGTVLVRMGLRYVSWSQRGFDATDSQAGRVLARLEPGIAPGAILLLHDGRATGRRHPTPVILEVLPVLLERIAERGLRAVTLPEAFGLTARPVAARPAESGNSGVFSDCAQSRAESSHA